MALQMPFKKEQKVLETTNASLAKLQICSYKISFSYSNSSNATIIKKLCKSKKLVKSQSGHTEKPFADH